MEKLIYSPKLKIPLFKLTWNPSSGEIMVEYLNVRHKDCSEMIDTRTMLIYLVEEEMKYKHDNKMLFTPRCHIPVGVLQQDENNGIYYLEVKHKKKVEKIKLSEYLLLLLQPSKKMNY